MRLLDYQPAARTKINNPEYIECNFEIQMQSDRIDRWGRDGICVVRFYRLQNGHHFQSSKQHVVFRSFGRINGKYF